MHESVRRNALTNRTCDFNHCKSFSTQWCWCETFPWLYFLINPFDLHNISFIVLQRFQTSFYNMDCLVDALLLSCAFFFWQDPWSLILIKKKCHHKALWWICSIVVHWLLNSVFSMGDRRTNIENREMLVKHNGWQRKRIMLEKDVTGIEKGSTFLYIKTKKYAKWEILKRIITKFVKLFSYHRIAKNL